MVGDVPADRVVDGLKELARRGQAEGRGKPTLPDLMAALESALRSRNGSLDRIVAVTSQGEVTARALDDRYLDAGVEKTVVAVEAAYQDGIQRAPKLEEIVETFLFVLGFEPERCLSIPAGLTIEDMAIRRTT
jgi:hypothetical protein